MFDSREKNLLFGSISAIFSLGILWYLLNFQIKSAMSYAIAVLTFVFVGLMGLFVFRNNDISAFSNKVRTPFIAGFGAVGICFLFLNFLKKNEDQQRDGAYVVFGKLLPVGVVFLLSLLLLFLAIVTVFFYQRRNENRIDVQARSSDQRQFGVLYFLFYFGMAVVYAAGCVYPNFFVNDIYHEDAYLHPIYSVYYGTPISELSHSMYGHYEFFYVLLMKLFGTSPEVVLWSLFVLAMIEAFIIFLVLHQLVSSPILRVFAAIAMTVPCGAIYRMVAYQTTPHRTLFGVFLLGYACLLLKKNKRTILGFIGGILLCGASVLWNTETGLICCVSFAAFWILWMLQKERLSLVFLGKSFLTFTASIVFPILLALLTVNGYNLAVGGDFIFKEFFYPLINGKFVEHYVMALEQKNYPYLYVMVLGLACVWYGFVRGFSADKSERNSEAIGEIRSREYLKEHSIIIGTLGVLILGTLGYYTTRAAYYALLITAPFVILALTYFAEKYLHKIPGVLSKNNGGQRGVSIYKGFCCLISFGCCLALSFITLLATSLPKFYMDNHKADFYSLPDVSAGLEWIQNNVPENTYAVGWGVDEWYGYLGWDAGYHMLGTTDVLQDADANADVYEALIEEANAMDALFLQEAAYSIVGEDYELIAETELKGVKYGYFVLQ